MRKPPYESLLAVVALLEAAANVTLDGGFLNSPAGWYCRIRMTSSWYAEVLIVPSRWSLSEANDTILDQTTWCSVPGPGAH